MKTTRRTGMYHKPNFTSGEAPAFSDTVCITLHVKDHRVRPTITPLMNRPLNQDEIHYAIKIADYAARALL